MTNAAARPFFGASPMLLTILSGIVLTFAIATSFAYPALSGIITGLTVTLLLVASVAPPCDV